MKYRHSVQSQSSGNHTYMYVCVYMYIYIYIRFFCMHICIPVCLSMYLSICIYIFIGSEGGSGGPSLKPGPAGPGRPREAGLEPEPRPGADGTDGCWAEL